MLASCFFCKVSSAYAISFKNGSNPTVSTLYPRQFDLQYLAQSDGGAQLRIVVTTQETTEMRRVHFSPTCNVSHRQFLCFQGFEYVVAPRVHFWDYRRFCYTCHAVLPLVYLSCPHYRDRQIRRKGETRKLSCLEATRLCILSALLLCLPSPTALDLEAIQV